MMNQKVMRGGTMEYGEYKKKVLNGEIDNIKTNNEKKYEVLINSYYIYRDNKKYEGVFYLSIIDEQLWNLDKSYPEAGIRVVGEQMQ